MKVIELKYNGQIFLVPTVPIAPILFYQRYGNYYADFQGWLISKTNADDQIEKQNFNLEALENEAFELEVKALD